MISSHKSKNGAAANAALVEKLVLCSLMLLSAGAFYIAGDYSKGSPSDGSVFPRLASGIVFLMSALALVVPAPAPVTEEQIEPRVWTPLIVAALTFAFLLLMPLIGYPILAPLWIGATMWVFGLRNLGVLIGVAVVLSAAAWILLARLAYSPPPAGILEPLF